MPQTTACSHDAIQIQSQSVSPTRGRRRDVLAILHKKPTAVLVLVCRKRVLRAVYATDDTPTLRVRSHAHRCIFAFLKLELIEEFEGRGGLDAVQSLKSRFALVTCGRDNFLEIHTSLFFIPLRDCPPPPPMTSSVGETKAHEYMGKEARVCTSCFALISGLRVFSANRQKN